MMKVAVAVAAISVSALPALAADHQPYSHGVKLFAYEGGGEHFCPAGTQPIRYNGVICCGEPNAHGYRDAPVVYKKKHYTPAKMNMTDPKSPSYAPERIPLGKSPDS